MRPILERHFRAVLDNAPDGVLVEARDSIAYVNAAYARLLGYPSAYELCEATVRDIAHPEDCDRLLFFGRCRAEGKPAPTRYTFRARGRGGKTVTLDASISAARCDGELLITTIEREVIRYLLEGRRSKEIALMLDISEKTIWTHRSRAFQKMALRGVGDLFRVAAETGAI